MSGSYEGLRGSGMGRLVVAAVVIALVALGLSTFAVVERAALQNNILYSPDTQTREFVVVNGDAGFNETEVGVPHDTFIPSQIIVNQGDTVKIHFYNTEDAENHTFTIGAPYNINVNLAGGQQQDITFTADQAGVFTYYCLFHVPTMSGQLIVQPSY